MVGVEDAKGLAARRELKEELLFARLMGVVGDVNFLGAPRVLKDARISA